MTVNKLASGLFVNAQSIDQFNFNFEFSMKWSFELIVFVLSVLVHCTVIHLWSAPCRNALPRKIQKSKIAFTSFSIGRMRGMLHVVPLSSALFCDVIWYYYFLVPVPVLVLQRSNISYAQSMYFAPPRSGNQILQILHTSTAWYIYSSFFRDLFHGFVSCTMSLFLTSLYSVLYFDYKE